jgi:hypothetical protein
MINVSMLSEVYGLGRRPAAPAIGAMRDLVARARCDDAAVRAPAGRFC